MSPEPLFQVLVVVAVTSFNIFDADLPAEQGLYCMRSGRQLGNLYGAGLLGRENGVRPGGRTTPWTVLLASPEIQEQCAVCLNPVSAKDAIKQRRFLLRQDEESIAKDTRICLLCAARTNEGPV